MDRIKMYNTIKKNGWAEEFKEKYNKNFTQGKNTELEDFINFKSEPKDVKQGTYVNKVAFIELISILQSEACIKDKEAKSVLKLI